MPGDQLVMEVVMTQRRFNTFTLEAKAYVDGKLAAEAQLRAAVVDKEAKQA
jgi:3-hydroxyacyl-[acyl-carrier-protein] dehydratase